jgi:Golgi phosphoprotein 3
VLTLTEEFLLLMLKDEGGTFVPAPGEALGAGLAGAALMDLGLRNRIDNDVDALWVVDRTPTGCADLDLVLGALPDRSAGTSFEGSLQIVGSLVPQIRELALGELVARGLLKRQDGRIMWIFPSRRYPIVDGREIRDIKLRLLDVLLGEELPDSRDACVLALIDLTNLVEHLVPSSELTRARLRLSKFAKLDLIGHQLRERIEREREILYAAIALHAGFH